MWQGRCPNDGSSTCAGLCVRAVKNDPIVRAAPPQAASDGWTAVAPSRTPSPPEHNYALEQDGEYGYQPGISADDAAKGVATVPLVMIRYRGHPKDVYGVEMRDESTGATLRMEYKEPCVFVKTQVIVGGQVIKSDAVWNADDSLMHAVFEDATSGQLEQLYAPARRSFSHDRIG